MQTMILSYTDQSKRLSSYAPYPTLPSSRPSMSNRSQSRTINSGGKRSVPRLESLPEVESVPHFEPPKPSAVSTERTNVARISKSSFAVTALLQHDEAIDRYRAPAEQTPRMTNGHLAHVQSPNHSMGKHADEHCLPGTIDQFVEAVQSMNDTVLLPSRLINEVDPLADGTNGQSQDAANAAAACSCQCHEPHTDTDRPVQHVENGDVDKYSLFMLLNVVSRQLQRTNLGTKGFSRTSEGHDRQLALLNEPLSRVDERAVAKAKQVCAQISALQKTISELTQAAHQVTNEYHAQSNPDRRK